MGVSGIVDSIASEHCLVGEQNVAMQAGVWKSSPIFLNSSSHVAITKPADKMHIRKFLLENANVTLTVGRCNYTSA